MGIDMRESAMSLLDAVQAEEREGFTVQNDQSADWCLEQIGLARREIERIERLRMGKIADLDTRCAALTRPHEGNIAYFTGLLEQYTRTLEIKPTKAGSKIYKLLHGTLSIKPQEPKYATDPEALAGWLERTGRGALVKIVRSPMWGELKKQGVSVLESGAVCTEDGEIIEGVTAEIRPERFTAEAK